ncbi:MAG: positive regulator of sigma RseC/MucC [Proteobacteria bacterium]|nr:positive regulator of sigma RseC/MucC [Pseudomonadota bacterium]
MIERRGKVIAIHTDSIQVAMQPESACSACGARRACQGEAAGRVFSLPLHPGLRCGDTVSLQMESGTLTLSALIAYLLPAITLILGAWCGEWLGQSDNFAMSGAALGLAGGMFAARLLARLFSHTELQPNVQACFQPPPFGAPHHEHP